MNSPTSLIPFFFPFFFPLESILLQFNSSYTFHPRGLRGNLGKGPGEEPRGKLASSCIAWLFLTSSNFWQGVFLNLWPCTIKGDASSTRLLPLVQVLVLDVYVYVVCSIFRAIETNPHQNPCEDLIAIY